MTGRQSRSLALPETSNIQVRNIAQDPLSPGLTTPRSDTRKIYYIIKIYNRRFIFYITFDHHCF